MASDKERIAFLQGELTKLDDPARIHLAELRQVLDGPSIWEMPSAGLESSVVKAIAAERDALGVRFLSAPAPSRGSRLPRRWLVGASAAAAVLVMVVTAVALIPDGGSEGDRLQSALAATGAAPAVTGAATFTKFDSGWRIELDAPDLRHLDDGHFYQAWLKNAEGVTVPIGTFNDGDDVVLWAGVSPRDFPTITVTAEQADGDQTSSGELVLAGPIVED